MFETQGGTRNRTRDLPKKGSAFITSSDHWTGVLATARFERAPRRTAALTQRVCALGTSSCSAWILSQRSCLVSRLRCAPASPRPRLCWHTFACLPGPPSMRGCSAYGPGPILPLRACLRLILFCTCPPLCKGVLWPMPAWVWRDVRSEFFFFNFSIFALVGHASSSRMHGWLSNPRLPGLRWRRRSTDHDDPECNMGCYCQRQLWVWHVHEVTPGLMVLSTVWETFNACTLGHGFTCNDGCAACPCEYMHV